jgi:hypothetical protein
MIIKSMSRHEASFAQLLAYVGRHAGEDRYTLRHNVLGQSLEQITTEFEGNGVLLRQRKNGVTMYHEIISMTRAKGISPEAQKEALRAITLDYINARSPHNLVLGQLHDDTDHMHYHLVISANPLGSRERHRLSKAEFRSIQIGIEKKVLQNHPELEQTPAMSRKAAKKLSHAGGGMKRRAGELPQRARVIEQLTTIFAIARSKDELFDQLTEVRLELYQRGKNFGVRNLDTGRKHRIVTLGLKDAFETARRRLENSGNIAVQKTYPPQNTVTNHLPLEASVKKHAPTHSGAPDASNSVAIAPTASTSTEETDMNIFQSVFDGVTAVIDVLSITTDTGKPLDNTQAGVSAAVRTSIAPRHASTIRSTPKPPAASTSGQSTPPATEAERIAQERMDEMNELREAEQNDNQRSIQSTR